MDIPVKITWEGLKTTYFHTLPIVEKKYSETYHNSRKFSALRPPPYSKKNILALHSSQITLTGIALCITKWMLMVIGIWKMKFFLFREYIKWSQIYID